MANDSFDIAIIGGGIVGLAVAMVLSQRYQRYRLVLIEKEPKIACHQTGHNSGVIHSGIYYLPGSLKAQLCVRGAQKLIRFAEENDIPYKLCGKLIVATKGHELPLLETLLDRGRCNGITGLELIDAPRIKDFEPHATGLRGLYSPNTGVINFQAVAHAMEKCYLKNGGRLIVDNPVTEIIKKGNQFRLNVKDGVIEVNYLVNCGGLFADKIAEMAGLKPKVRIVPIRGEYYGVRPEKGFLVKNLIYPVPSPDLPFLGVHLTRTLDGTLKTGPNAVLALAREGYRRTDINFKYLWELASDFRFWRMARTYWKLGLFEVFRSINKTSFVNALRRFVPEIQDGDLVSGPTGVRAQCIDEHGRLVNDFQIEEGSKSIHVLNVPSPAATASLSIADYIVNLAGRLFGLK